MHYILHTCYYKNKFAQIANMKRIPYGQFCWLGCVSLLLKNTNSLLTTKMQTIEMGLTSRFAPNSAWRIEPSKAMPMVDSGAKNQPARRP